MTNRSSTSRLFRIRPDFPKLSRERCSSCVWPELRRRQLGALRRSGRDLAELLDRVDTLMSEAGTSDRASLFAIATRALSSQPSALSPLPSALPVLLLDVPFDSEAEDGISLGTASSAPPVRSSRFPPEMHGR